MQTQAFQRSSVQTCINTSPRVCITFGSTIWASKIIATTTFSNSNNTHWLRFITIFIAGTAYNRYLIDIIKGSEHEIIFNPILWILGKELSQLCFNLVLSYQTSVNTFPSDLITFFSWKCASHLITTMTSSRSNITCWLRFTTVEIAGTALKRVF